MKGLSNKEIGKRLNVGEGTVKMMLHMMYERTGTGNRTQLALMFKGVNLNGGHSRIDAPISISYTGGRLERDSE